MNDLQIRTAERRQAKIRMILSGISGTGKTYSALKIARGFVDSWDEIGLIDTESGSGDLYSHFGEYKILTLRAPFSPQRYIEAIKLFEKAGVKIIIIDSATHEWDGLGGCLDIHKHTKGFNSFMNWKGVTEDHNKFTQAILQSPCHIIVTTRRKKEYEETMNDGKKGYAKVGTAEVQRPGFEFEFTVAILIDSDHNGFVEKDRTEVFAATPKIELNESVGEALRAWGESGTRAETQTINESQQWAPQKTVRPKVDPSGKVKVCYDKLTAALALSETPVDEFFDAHEPALHGRLRDAKELGDTKLMCAILEELAAAATKIPKKAKVGTNG